MKKTEFKNLGKNGLKTAIITLVGLKTGFSKAMLC